MDRVASFLELDSLEQRVEASTESQADVPRAASAQVYFLQLLVHEARLGLLELAVDQLRCRLQSWMASYFGLELLRAEDLVEL